MLAGHPRNVTDKGHLADPHSIGNRVNIHASEETAEQVHQGFEAIHTAHGDGGLGKINLYGKRNLPRGVQGGFVKGRRVERHVNIREHGSQTTATTVVETGHFIDDSWGGSAGYASEKNHAPDIADAKRWIRQAKSAGRDPSELESHLRLVEAHHALNQAIAASPEVKELNDQPASSTTNYLRRKHEIFSRAYRQYITEKSGHPALLKVHDETRQDASGRRETWSKENFAPIREKIEGVMREKGWL